MVDEWIDQYKVNRNAALLSLNQFFITAAGCKGVITAKMQQTMEDVAIIRKMTEEFDEVGDEFDGVLEIAVGSCCFACLR